MVQTTCLVSSSNPKFMHIYDRLPRSVRHRLRLHKFDLCIGCLFDRAQCVIGVFSSDWEYAFHAAIDMMEEELSGGFSRTEELYRDLFREERRRMEPARFSRRYEDGIRPSLERETPTYTPRIIAAKWL